MPDFTSLALIKLIPKEVLSSIDKDINRKSLVFSVKLLEGLKNNVVMGNQKSYDLTIQACGIMSSNQLVQFLFSIKGLSVDALARFFDYVNESETPEAKAFKAHYQYLVHSGYFSDVFLDSKLVS